MLRRSVAIIIQIAFSVLGRLGAGVSGRSPWSRLKAIMYNAWMNKRFSSMHCRYQYPVNFRRGEQYFKIGERTGFGKFAVLTAWDEYEGEHFSPSWR